MCEVTVITDLGGAAELLLQLGLLRSQQVQLVLQRAALSLHLLQQSLALLLRPTAQSRQAISEVLLQVPEITEQLVNITVTRLAFLWGFT